MLCLRRFMLINLMIPTAELVLYYTGNKNLSENELWNRRKEK